MPDTRISRQGGHCLTVTRAMPFIDPGISGCHSKTPRWISELRIRSDGLVGIRRHQYGKAALFEQADHVQSYQDFVLDNLRSVAVSRFVTFPPCHNTGHLNATSASRLPANHGDTTSFLRPVKRSQ